MSSALATPSAASKQFDLRPYQREAVDAVYDFLRSRDDHPCVVIPTGGGKTPVIATICRDAVNLWNGRVVILAHVKELLEQAADKLRAIAPDVPVGIYSAGLRRKDLGYAVTIAGIQSIYQKACDLGPVDLVIVDEAHLIPPDGEGMYRQFLADAKVVNPHMRVIALTATPYRMKTGTICSPDTMLNEICFEIGVRELIVQGWLSPLRTKAGAAKVDTSELHVRGGEFIAGEVEDLMDTDALVEATCAEIVGHTKDRRSVLIFTSGVRHGEHVVRMLRERHGVDCGFVEGNTPGRVRDHLIERFKAGDLRFLANVNVLTTGFDAPNVDCVAMLRPTLSPGLYYQMVGRGFRIHPGKNDCLVLDFGGNVLRHGPVDQIKLRTPGTGDGEAPAKECPECSAVIAAGYAVCPECGHEFPPPEREKHSATATDAGVLSGQVTNTKYSVMDVFYTVHTKRDAPPDAPRTLRVDYQVGFGHFEPEWVCFEHPRNGYARRKAEQWWRTRSNAPVPDTAEEASNLANNGALAPTTSITVRSVTGEKFARIVEHEIGEKPPWDDEAAVMAQPVPARYEIPEDDIPF
ncbi:MAG TPA: DEAD/DEAH box helicase family protein [Phycisphaerales bacterium]|nr:DEAD/DEAH box helicase family protein [Phycisphaerales bacterium]